MVRWIKLKEFDLDVDTTVEPTAAYIAGCDGSIRQQEFRFRTDAAGFIRSGEPGFDTDRVIILGDSSAASLFVEEGFRLGAVVERRLRQAGRQADVLVGAASDCTTLHAVNIFLNKCVPLRPAQLIYMSCGSDGSALCCSAGYWMNDAEKAFGPIAQAGTGADTPDRETPDLPARWAMLSVLLSILNTYGTELILVTAPHRRQIDPYLTEYYKGVFDYHDKLTRIKHAINHSTRRFARAHGLTCIDAELLSDDSTLFYDIVHLNQRGCHVVGGLVAERMLDCRLDIDAAAPRCP